MPTCESELTMTPVGKYMQAQEQPRQAGRKTSKWYIYSRSDRLGVVEWYGPWRQYVFVPDPYSIYSAGCMADLIAFMKGLKGK